MASLKDINLPAVVNNNEGIKRFTRETGEKINRRKTQEMRIYVLAASSSTVRIWIKKSADMGSFVIPNSIIFHML